MVYLKDIQKSTPIGITVSGTIDQKTYLKKFRGASAPLAPLDPPMGCQLMSVSLRRYMCVKTILNIFHEISRFRIV